MYLHAGTQQEMNDFLNDVDGLTDEGEEDSLSEHNESLLAKRKRLDSGGSVVEPPSAGMLKGKHVDKVSDPASKRKQTCKSTKSDSDLIG